jgi:arylsulfatase A-like enzyme
VSVDRPNILWIFSDQHRGQALGCAGDVNVRTPNLDRLAADGIRFSNAYSNTPICAPFRASLYTGKRITSHGVNSLFVPLLPGHRVLPQELHDAGYLTAHYGKWHLSGGDCPSHFVSPYFRPGWDDWLGWENSNRPWMTEYSSGNLPVPIRRLHGYQTDAMVDLSIEWLHRHAADAPWFHVLSIEPPHPPNTAPERTMARVRDRDIRLRPNVPADSPDVDTYIMAIRAYYAQIENLDENVGRLLDALEQTGQAARGDQRRADLRARHHADHARTCRHQRP